MVKAEVKTPNKRKSLANDTPAKKVKVENGNNKPFTPKNKNQSPQKNNDQGSIQKSNKKIKNEPASPGQKNIKPFAGTKQLNKNQKPKKEKPQNNKGNNNKSEEAKKKRRNQYSGLIKEVRGKEGTSDAALLKSLDEKIEAITSKGELTKTAKKKLGILKKFRTIVTEGSAAASAQAKAQALEFKAEREKKKAEKSAAAPAAAQPKKKQAVPKVAAPVKKEEDDDDEDESDAEDDDSDAAAEEGDSDEEVEGEADSDDEAEGEEDDDEEDDDDDDEEEDDDEDESEEEAPAPAPKGKLPVKEVKPGQNSSETKPQQNKKQPTLDQLKTTDLLKKGQKRFVLFVGNIPYDTTKQDLTAHFAKVGGIVDVRLPTEKGSNKPRGFAYVEVQDETAYEKCLSMHHSQLKGRRINVMYTQGGKKKGDDKKKEIKAKNMKLHALRRQGKLAGSVKHTQKRSFRRNKSKNFNKEPTDS